MVFSSDYSLCIPALRPYGVKPYPEMEFGDFDLPHELEPYTKRRKMWENTPYAPSGPAFEYALRENLEIARLFEETTDFSGFLDSMGLDVVEPLLDNYYQASSRCTSPIDFHHLVDPNLIQESSTGSGAQAALPSDSASTTSSSIPQSTTASSNENPTALLNASFVPMKNELPQITEAATNLGLMSNASSAAPTLTREPQVTGTDFSGNRATNKPLVKIVGKREITSADLNTGVCEPTANSQILSRTAYSPQYLNACISSYTNLSTNGRGFVIGRRVLPHNSFITPVSLDVKASVLTSDVPKSAAATNLVVQPLTSVKNRSSSAHNTATSFPVTVLSNSSTKSSFSITANKMVVSSCSMTSSWPNSVGTITTKSSQSSQSQRQQQQHPSQNAVVYLPRNKEAPRSSLQNEKPRGAMTPSSAARVTTVHPISLTPQTSVESAQRISVGYSASEYSRALESVITPPVSPPSYNNSASSSPVGGSSAEADYPMQTIAEPTPAAMVSSAIGGSSSGNSSLVVKSDTEVAGLNLQPHFLPYPSSPDSEYEGTRYGSCKTLLTANNDPLLSSSSPLLGPFIPNPSVLATGVTNSSDPTAADQQTCTCISGYYGLCQSHSPLICGRPTCTTYGGLPCSNSSTCLGHHFSTVSNLSPLTTDHELSQELSTSYLVDDSTPMLNTTNSLKSHETPDSGMSSSDRISGVSPNSMGFDSVDEGYPTSQPSSDTDLFDGNFSENELMGMLRWSDCYQLETSELMECDSLSDVENSNELPQGDNNVSLEKPEVVKAMVYTTGDKEVKVGGIQVELQRADDVHTDHSYCRPDSPTSELCQPMPNVQRRRPAQRGGGKLLGTSRQVNSSRNLSKSSPSVSRSNFIRDCSTQPSTTTSVQNAKKTPVWQEATAHFNPAHKRPSSMPGVSDVFAYCTRPTSDTSSAVPPSKKRKNTVASTASSSNGTSYSSGDEIDVIGVYGNGFSAPRPHPARRGRPPKAAGTRGGAAVSRGTRPKTQVMGVPNLYMGALPTKGSPSQFGASPMRVASPIIGNSSPRVQSPLFGAPFVRVVSPIMGMSPFGNTSPFVGALRGASPIMGASATMRVASPSFGSSSPRIASPVPRMTPDKLASSSRISSSSWGTQSNASSASRSISTAKPVDVESTHGKRWKGKSAANSEIVSIAKERAPCRQRTPSRKATQSVERIPSRGSASILRDSDVIANTPTSRGRSGNKRGRPSKAATSVSSGLSFSNWGSSPATKPRGGSRSNSRRAKSPEEIDLTGCDSPVTTSVRSTSKSTRGNSSSRGQKRGRNSSKTTSVGRSRPTSPAADVCGYPIDDPRLQIAPRAFRTEKGMLVHLGTGSSAPVSSTATTCGRSAGSRGGRGRGRGRGASRTTLSSPLQDAPTFSNPGSLSAWAGSNLSAGGTFLPTGTYLSLGNRSSSVPSNDLLKPPATFLLPRSAANKANGVFAADITRAYAQNAGRGRGGRKPAASRTPRVTFCAETTTRRARGPNSRLDDQAKRKRHNTMERKRRNDIREAFDVLRQHLTSTDPRVKLEKLPKVRVLLAARRTFDDLTMAVADGSVTSRKHASRMQALTTVIRKMTRDDGVFKFLEAVYHNYLTKIEILHREARHRNYVPLV